MNNPIPSPRWISAAEAYESFGGGGSGDVVGPDSAIDGNLAVFDGVTGKLIKDGGAPGGGSSFLSNNIARVDLSGDDETGTVGDLTKPFLTVQSAITAFEATGTATSGSLVTDNFYTIVTYVEGDDFTNVGGSNESGVTFQANGTDPTDWSNGSTLRLVIWAVIDIGNNYFTEDLTTNLVRLAIHGSASSAWQATQSSSYTKPFDSLTIPDGAELLLQDVGGGNADISDDNSTVIATAGDTGACKVYLENAFLGNIDATAELCSLFGDGFSQCGNNLGGTIFPSNVFLGGTFYDLQGNAGDLETQSNKDTDGTLSDNSDVKYPSQSAVKTYADNHLPKIVAYARATNQSAANANVLSYTALAEGSYEISMTLQVVAATAIVTSLKCDYSNENNDNTSVVLPVIHLNGSFAAGISEGAIANESYSTPVFHIRAGTTNPTILFYTTAGTFTGVTYNVEAIVKRIQ